MPFCRSRTKGSLKMLLRRWTSKAPESRLAVLFKNHETKGILRTAETGNHASGKPSGTEAARQPQVVSLVPHFNQEETVVRSEPGSELLDLGFGLRIETKRQRDNRTGRWIDVKRREQ